MWEDNNLLAWYLWYDEAYGPQTWEKLVAFACSEYGPVILKDEGIRLYKKKYNGSYQPWGDFEETWRKVMEIANHGVHTTPLEREWLVCHPEETNTIHEYLNEEGSAPTVISSAEIMIGLITKGLDDLNPSMLSLNQTKVSSIISQSFLRNNLVDRLQISPEGWYQMFQTEWNKEDNSILQFLKRQLNSVQESIGNGWNWIKEKQQLIVASIQQLQDNFPNNTDEWTAFISVMGPTLFDLGVDIGTDFIPIVGEIKALKNAIHAYQSSKYGEAAFELLGGIAGIIPIGDIVKAGSKVANTAITTFKAFKVVKVLAKVSANIFRRIKHFTSARWKIVWDDGVKKLFLNNPTNTFYSEITQGMARSMDDLSEFPFAMHADALQLSADAYDEGLDALDSIEDALQTSDSDFWSSLRPLFKRGNDFNREGYIKYGFSNSEIHLGNVKRLDAYLPGEKIISRKATDLDNIKEATWRSYCNEIVTKYRVNTPVNSLKMPDEPPLSGRYFLEIPASNQTAQKLESFSIIAREYGQENGGIEIIFLNE